MFELISDFNGNKTLMLVDKEKGRPLELDSIAGAVLRRCELLGIEAPYTATVAVRYCGSPMRDPGVGREAPVRKAVGTPIFMPLLKRTAYYTRGW